MATKQELEQDIEILRARIESLEHELTLARAVSVPRAHNPFHYELARLILERPWSISELAEHFNREPRLISQWLFQLKAKHGAQIITLADGRKRLENNIFGMESDTSSALDDPD